MSITTITSDVRAVDLPNADYPPCCGQQPEVFTWPRGIGKGFIGVICRNPRCPNHLGVLDCSTDIRQKWEQFRCRV